MPWHKTSPNKFKKIEIISRIFSGHNGMKLEINHKKKPGKNSQNLETKQHATDQLLGQWRNQRRNKKIPETYENENMTY